MIMFLLSTYKRCCVTSLEPFHSLISLMSDQLHFLYTVLYDVFLVKCKLLCFSRITVNTIFPITDFINTGENIAPSQTEPKSMSIIPTATTLTGNVQNEVPIG